ncbi:MAG: dioxygenase [Proteobacteria bacterium]|nr:MAG: dioxygenase [Pseudomonadota bacterium]
MSQRIRHNHEESALNRDLEALQKQKVNRRRIFAWASVGAVLSIAGGLLRASSLKAAAVCKVVPTETAGPYPGDGSNGANALAISGIVRSDITASVGGSETVAQGVPLRVEITLINASGECEALEGYAIYIWHCDRIGDYSLYTGAAKSENYLRGVQATDADGLVAFDSIFPGCYPGRWPHIHFEVYKSIEVATTYRTKIATSQLALPTAACKAAYATSGYAASVTNLSRISLSSDMVFADGATLQLASVTGSVNEGFVAKLVVAVKA